jgi:hypothetical protein
MRARHPPRVSGGVPSTRARCGKHGPPRPARPRRLTLPAKPEAPALLDRPAGAHAAASVDVIADLLPHKTGAGGWPYPSLPSTRAPQVMTRQRGLGRAAQAGGLPCCPPAQPGAGGFNRRRRWWAARRGRGDPRARRSRAAAAHHALHLDVEHGAARRGAAACAGDRAPAGGRGGAAWEGWAAAGGQAPPGARVIRCDGPAAMRGATGLPRWRAAAPCAAARAPRAAGANAPVARVTVLRRCCRDARGSTASPRCPHTPIAGAGCSGQAAAAVGARGDTPVAARTHTGRACRVQAAARPRLARASMAAEVRVRRGRAGRRARRRSRGVAGGRERADARNGKKRALRGQWTAALAGAEWLHAGRGRGGAGGTADRRLTWF